MFEKKLNRLHFISQETATESHEEVIASACAEGVSLVQLRIKNKPKEEVLAIAKRVKLICTQYNATFILNDYVAIAKEVGADGVHIGKSDITPKEARQLLGDHAIVGATANTLEDVLYLNALGVVDYVGLGPYRFTPTKEKLSPILGLEGYQTILKTSNAEGCSLPIYAIGGITPVDIPSLLGIGVYGVAVSGLISHSNSKKSVIEEFKNQLYHYA